MAPILVDLIVRNAAEVLAMRERPSGGEARVERNAAVGCSAGRVAWVGPDAEADRQLALAPGGRILDASGCTVTPGFVDCHTHLVFGGERADEFALRCRGASYLEIAQRGGGIASTVRATRIATEDALVALARPRLQRLLSFGITTAEVKSGYGLDLPNEVKMLRAAARLAAEGPIELVPTLLCAHAIPEEHAASRERYVDLCVNEIIPEVARLGLARFCDAFVEQGAFTVEEGRRILARAAELGLRPRLHADQLSAAGASQLAAELHAASADHLEALDDAGAQSLAQAGVAAVLIPTSTLFLRQGRYAPGRRLWDAGVEVALATNLNPGSAMTENVNLALSLACLQNGLTPGEALWALTRGAARAIALEDRVGALVPGLQADLVVHACASHLHLPYHLGIPHARAVVKAGRVVYEAALAPCGA